jgi:hypothetical protein
VANFGSGKIMWFSYIDYNFFSEAIISSHEKVGKSDFGSLASPKGLDRVVLSKSLEVLNAHCKSEAALVSTGQFFFIFSYTQWFSPVIAQAKYRNLTRIRI